MNEKQPLKPIELQLGNFIECFGKIETVTGLIPQDDGSWYICHNSCNQSNNPLPDDMRFRPYPIDLTDEWKKCLKIDKYRFPDWIQYVHQAQNYILWYANVNLLDIMDWDLLKLCSA